MFTAVITTYKRPVAVVKRAILSVLGQTYQDFELIVVDDSPNDYPERESIKSLVKNLNDNRILLIQHKETLGACAARNTGLNNSKGEFIGFLDDDDEWLPNKVEKMLELFAMEDDSVGLLYCKFFYLDETKNIEWKPIKEFKKFKKGNVFKNLIIDNFVGSSSFPVLRTSYLREIGGFDERMLSCQDYDVWLRMSEKYNVDYVDLELVRFHIHQHDSIGKNNSKKISGQMMLIDKNIKYLKKHKYAYWCRLKKIAPMYSNNHEVKKGLKILLKMICLRPFRIVGNITTFLRIVK